MLAPTRERDFAKIESSLLSSSWVFFLALWIVCRAHSGRHFATLGALLGALGAVLGDSWALLASSWAAPVDVVSRWVPTGVSGGSLESVGRVSGTPLLVPRGILGHPRPWKSLLPCTRERKFWKLRDSFLDRLLDPLCGSLEGLSGPFWEPLGPSWSPLGRSWGGLGSFLRALWALSGCSWAHLAVFFLSW